MSYKMRKNSRLVCSAALAFIINSLTMASAEAHQMMGAQIEAMQKTGYGMYVVRMKPSGHPGTISSFFLFHTDKLWPKGWAELDIEFTPGYRTKGDQAPRFVLDASEPHASSFSCYDPDGLYDTAFFARQCHVVSTLNGQTDISRFRNQDGDIVNRSVSINAYSNSPHVLNQSATRTSAIVQSPGDHQVFYNPAPGVDPYGDFYNYYIWYTPSGTYWAGPISEKESPFPEQNATPHASSFPEPVFAKIWNTNQGDEQGQKAPPKRFAVPTDIAFRNPAQKEALAVATDHLTPLDLQTGAVLHHGRPMQMMFNIWDGSKTALSTPQVQPWGGWQPPSKPSAAVYQKVAYFPLKSVIPHTSGKRYPGPKDYSYEASSHYSDFTTRQGQFILNGHKASFSQMWAASDGAFAPLGTLSGYSVFCYPRAPLKANVGPGPNWQSDNGIHLQLRPFDDYAIPATGLNAGQDNNYTNCSWADTIGAI